ncbi:Werner syndrome-like exonuclease [Quillaja saponaria]|uniref:Werner syndrome-like exonuclease n=1 Tax=Quillaja saponaria TaxID=32244 RepID=A0AAD7QKV3_QUISA|nr:Werner syndrome-like exonuclease [Quillaja saponaria]
MASNTNPHDPQFYTIDFHEFKIQTTVTASSRVVDRWIFNIDHHIHLRRYRFHSDLIVGLDTEWRPNFEPETDNPVAILQLCAGHQCLIFKFLHADTFPSSLVAFLGNKNITFAGMGNKEDAEKLFKDCGLRVSRTMDVGEMAVNKYSNWKELKYMGLKKLALTFTGKLMKKPKEITLSCWDAEELSYAQVEYACIDAFVSSQLGMHFKGVLESVHQPVLVTSTCPLTPTRIVTCPLTPTRIVPVIYYPIVIYGILLLFFLYFLYFTS